MHELQVISNIRQLERQTKVFFIQPYSLSLQYVLQKSVHLILNCDLKLNISDPHVVSHN